MELVKNNLQKIYAVVYYILFSIPLLSPSIRGNTLYLHWFIYLLDVVFIRYAINATSKIFKEQKVIVILTVLLVCAFFFSQWSMCLKIIMLYLGVLYLHYSYQHDLLKYLWIGVNLNIIFGILQFIVYYVRPDLLYFIGPTNIAQSIWGNYACDTFTNFFTQMGIATVSGLYREHGFFNSFVIVSALLYHYLYKNEKKNKLQYFLFLIGFIISFSKSSIFLIPIFFLIRYKNLVNKINYWGWFATILVFLVFFSIILENIGMFSLENTTNFESYIHRFSGYIVMKNLQLGDYPHFLTGFHDLLSLPLHIFEEMPYLNAIARFNKFCGLPELMLSDGIILSLCFLYLLGIYIKFDSASFLVLTLLTFTTTYITLQSFVIVSYYYVYLLSESKKDALQRF